MSQPAPPFLRACRSEPVEHVPVWFMRQAGRSLPEYRDARGTTTILEAVRCPDLATELTLQPVRRYGVDAAILFSDIVVPLAAVGFGVEIVTGVGPVVSEPFSSRSDLERIGRLDPEEHVPYVLETLRNLAAELAATDVALLGFAGAPFTLASYMVEGGPSRTYTRTKTLMRGDPGLWSELLRALAEMSVRYLRAQVAAGAQAVQLFDSWAGALSVDDYEKHVLPATSHVLRGLDDLGVPRIHFGVGTGELLGSMASAGCEVIGVDWHVRLDEARRRVGAGVALQGNLDPTVCLAPWEVVEAEAVDVLRRGGGTGHVFNLGHGVLPESDPDVLKRLTDLVHGAGSSGADDPAASGRATPRDGARPKDE